jgi:hypothetical protein
MARHPVQGIDPSISWYLAHDRCERRARSTLLMLAKLDALRPGDVLRIEADD